MKHALITFFAIAIGSVVMLGEAEAKRLGGGASSGIQRSAPIKRDAAPAQAPTQNAAPTRPGQPSGASRWLGPIAGIAAGLGLAALFSHLGLSEELATFALLALLAIVAVAVIRALLRRTQPQSARLQYAGGPAEAPIERSAVSGVGNASVYRANVLDVPADFDAENFVRHAKRNFLRLQAANDAGDMEDIRKFTTPEMYAEIKLQYEERGKAAQKTEVVSLDAELIDFATELGEQIASVRFSGTMRENANGAAEHFDEIWHITKAVDDSRGWAIAGIQQTN